MQLYVFSVYDKAVGAYLQPFFSRSKGEALRQFMEACADEKAMFGKHASDFTLMYLGMYDDVSGLFDTSEPERLLGALEARATVVQGEGQPRSN
jgi:hypothetical protein